MRYKECRESFKNGKQTYTFTCACRRCSRKEEITVQGPDLFRYNQGAPMQVAFPYLNTSQREMLISGTCGPCFDEMFPPEDEEEAS